MPKEPQKPGGPRQRPISCKFCRTRKLRCSRDSPCSNCLSRGIACELEQVVPSTSTIDDRSRSELLERIRKLEAVVEQHARSTPAPSYPPSPDSNLGPTALNSQVLGTFADAAKQTQKGAVPSQSEQLDRDFAWLESIYDGTDCAVSYAPFPAACIRDISLCAMSSACNYSELMFASRMSSLPQKLVFAHAHCSSWQSQSSSSLVPPHATLPSYSGCPNIQKQRFWWKSSSEMWSLYTTSCSLRAFRQRWNELIRL